MTGQRKLTASEKKLFVVTGLAVALLLTVSAWRQWVDVVPDVVIPTPRMPSPNAYDFYVKAATAHVPANPAVDAIHDTNIIPKAQWKTFYPTANKEAWLRLNAKSLNLLRQGFQHECRMPPVRSLSSKHWPLNSRFREFARKLVVESHARSERDNWSGAADSALDILKLGHDLTQGGNLIDYLLGSAINAIGRKELWTTLPHLSAAKAKSKARRLEKIIQNRVLYADVQREEKYSGQATLLEAMRSSEWDQLELSEGTKLSRFKERWQLMNTPKRTIFNNYTRYMDALIASAEKSYDANAALPPIPGDIYNQAFKPTNELAHWLHARDNASNNLALAALALRAYRLEHNRAPQSLNELVPRYLKQVPTDAFGNDQPLRYKLSGANTILYSVGSDGIDNNGRPMENTKFAKTDRRRFLMQRENKGDMVAGINH